MKEKGLHRPHSRSPGNAKDKRRKPLELASCHTGCIHQFRAASERHTQSPLTVDKSQLSRPY